MRLIAFVIACVILVACDDGGPQSSTASVRDSAGVRIVENVGDLWAAPVRWHASAEPELRIGAVDGDEPYLFDGVRGVVILSDGRIVVANGGDQSIRWYAPDGRFLFQRGGAGDGPGEFSRLNAISVADGDSVLAVDWAGMRYSIFGPDGGTGPTVRIEGLTAGPGRMFSLTTGDRILGTSGSSTAQLGGRLDPGVYRVNSPVLRLTRDGRDIDTIGVFPSADVEIMSYQGSILFGPSRFARSLSYTVAGDRVLIGTADRMQYELYSASGQHLASVRAPDIDVRLTPDIEEAYRARLRARADSAPAEERAGFERTIAEMRLPATVPGYSAIITDAAGNVWVGEYRFDDQPPGQFLVFDAEGVFSGRVSVPPSVRVLAVRGDRIWGRATDELGVEYVVAYVLDDT